MPLGILVSQVTSYYQIFCNQMIWFRRKAFVGNPWSLVSIARMTSIARSQPRQLQYSGCNAPTRKVFRIHRLLAELRFHWLRGAHIQNAHGPLLDTFSVAHSVDADNSIAVDKVPSLLARFESNPHMCTVTTLLLGIDGFRVA
mmetsp:Transcript_15035/g.37563  ORF Transcript_15035/g.37563 Transcript_15035/m.37563 type:complete len:143 (-) Transcript_15035:1310-1738(-)